MTDDGRLAAVERRVADLEAFKSVLEERRVHTDRRFDKVESGLDKINASLGRVVFLVLGAIGSVVVNIVVSLATGGGGAP